MTDRKELANLLTAFFAANKIDLKGVYHSISSQTNHLTRGTLYYSQDFLYVKGAFFSNIKIEALSGWRSDNIAFDTKFFPEILVKNGQLIVKGGLLHFVDKLKKVYIRQECSGVLPGEAVEIKKDANVTALADRVFPELAWSLDKHISECGKSSEALRKLRWRVSRVKKQTNFSVFVLESSQGHIIDIDPSLVNVIVGVFPIPCSRSQISTCAKRIAAEQMNRQIKERAIWEVKGESYKIVQIVGKARVKTLPLSLRVSEPREFTFTELLAGKFKGFAPVNG